MRSAHGGGYACQCRPCDERFGDKPVCGESTANFANYFAIVLKLM